MASSSVPAKSIKQENDEKNFIPSNEFVLQKHAAFFDRNHDGVIYPWETYKGFRAIGIDIATSTLAALFINIGLSGKTRPGKFPNLLFPIEIRNIQRGKHASDSGVYDSDGRFVPSKFEEIFIKHAHTYPDALTEKELKEMLKDNRQPKNVTGWIAALTEWRLLFSIAKDKNGLLQKDKVRAVYDGSLFEQMEKERSASKNKEIGAHIEMIAARSHVTISALG